MIYSEEYIARYHLRLADGTIWEFSATPCIETWLDAMARIMELPSGGSAAATHRIMFVAYGDNEGVVGRHLPSDAGWSFSALGKVIRIWSHDHVPETVVELNSEFIDHHEIRVINMWSSLRPIHLHAAACGGGPFHATLAEYNGRGILIAAAGDTGKTTCYRRLPPPWSPLSDDQALVVRKGDGSFVAHPFPTWSEHLMQRSDQSWPAARSVSLKAVFFLEQADVDEVLALSPGRASPLLFDAQKQVWERYWARLGEKTCEKQRTMVFDNACTMARTIPTFVLKATLHGRFWEEIEAVLEP